MPFQKGHVKQGGRKKGTGNKLAVEVRQRLEQCGHDPIWGMIEIANDETASLELRGRMNAELAQYVYPKRKAIEHTGLGGAPIDVNVSATDELLSILAGIAARRNPKGST